MKKLLFPLAIVVLLIIAVYFIVPLNTANREPPIYNPADLNPALVDGSLHELNLGHRVMDFSLINQDGDTITQADYEGTIYVTDFFFTRCPSICPAMSNNMAQLQEIFKEEDKLKLLSLSVTPEYDSVAVLKKYALKYRADISKWNITTGNKEHIYTLARKSYFAVVDEGDGGLQDFIHTPNFILVDTLKQIRGIYDGTKKKEITRLVEDINSLLKNVKD
ncbi:SCO family protein [uncultured Muriicola sp.]|uniref:SCO family protein n=1 Tax=uncultured Muriicola sp. TaxID=1583102 RepID=UPI002615B28F|nr:SCO family protein [uncultured Muriicola sp.]